MPSARASLQLVNHGDLVFAIGGRGVSDVERRPDVILRCDLGKGEKCEWDRIYNLTTPRQDHVALFIPNEAVQCLP